MWLELAKPDRAYSPETIAVMTEAFETVSQSVSKQVHGNDDVRRQLALIILRHVDEGERDPIRLSSLAFAELAGLDGPATK